jgi:hypothetical protein
MNRVEFILSNILAVIIIISLGIFKISDAGRRVDYWLNTKYLYVRSLLQTMR